MLQLGIWGIIYSYLNYLFLPSFHNSFAYLTDVDILPSSISMNECCKRQRPSTPSKEPDTQETVRFVGLNSLKFFSHLKNIQSRKI